MPGIIFIFIEIWQIVTSGGKYACRDRFSQTLKVSFADTQTLTRTLPGCSVLISPCASMSEGEAVGGCDLSGLQQESSF